MDFLPPRSGGIDGVEVVARVQKDNFEKVLRGSGEFGVFSRPFFVKGDAHVYKDVPLPVEFDLQAALRKAKAVGPSILGLSCGERVSDCVRRSATSRVSLARSTQRRNPRGLSGKDGRPEICLCRGAKLRCRHFWQVGIAQSKHQAKRLQNLGRVWSEESPRHQ